MIEKPNTATVSMAIVKHQPRQRKSSVDTDLSSVPAGSVRPFPAESGVVLTPAENGLIPAVKLPYVAEP
jgi:hypothetical protein